MKAVHVGLSLAGIVLLFAYWNRKVIFGISSPSKLNTRMNNEAEAVDASDDKDVGVLGKKMAGSISSEIQKNARFAQMYELKAFNSIADGIATASFIESILSRPQTEACVMLMTEFDLSSALILKKHVDDEEHKKMSKFKRISESDGNKEGEKEKDSKAADNKTIDIKSVSNHQKEDSESAEIVDDPNHNDHDPLEVVLYCKNMFRMPRVGRSIRVVESKVNVDEKYLIELIK